MNEFKVVGQFSSDLFCFFLNQCLNSKNTTSGGGPKALVWAGQGRYARDVNIVLMLCP